jgi:hypothetical protein
MSGGLAQTGSWFLVTTAELVALFLALSFLVGLLQAWLPQEKVRSLFERRRPITGYLVGAALGAVTPFCSYSTIPVLVGLLRTGVPFGPTMAFLFASTSRYERARLPILAPLWHRTAPQLHRSPLLRTGRFPRFLNVA